MLLGASGSGVSPRGRTRVIRALRSLRATTLVTTPCGALDLLARIFIEFGLQPEDLGLRRILVGGEIPTPGALGQLGDEFDCDVRHLLLDPFTGAALAQGVDRFDGVNGEVVGRALLDRDQLAPDRPGPHELVVRTGPDDSWLRTGALFASVTEPGSLPPVDHTVGDHVLARGRWLSLPAVDAALASIDGVAAWQLETSREGTLDRVVVVVALGRQTLVDDKMWAGRIREAVASVFPVRAETRVVGVDDLPTSQPVIDHRGHHLGVDRERASTPS
jgi:phenylacetate-CoA ligase